LRNGWVEIWYQPKIDLKRKCLIGAETLARLRHPRFGVLLPGSFFPGLGEAGMSLLAEHALIAVLHNWTKFDDAGFNLHLAVNLPASVLGSMPLAQVIERHRPESEHWPGIIIEVCEDQIVRELGLVGGSRSSCTETAFRLRSMILAQDIRRFQLYAAYLLSSSSSTAASSRSARSTQQMPRSAKRRSTWHIDSIAPQLPKGSRAPPICRRLR